MIVDISKKILIVGLGLLGGSYARSLKRFGFHISAITLDQSSIDYALKEDIIDEGSTELDERIIGEADLVIFALYPHVGYGQKNYAYATRRLPSKGGLKVIEKLKNRLGILLGAIAFVAITQAGEGYVWKVDLDAPKVYSAQIIEVLEKY